jgi:hypothetical protein
MNVISEQEIEFVTAVTKQQFSQFLQNILAQTLQAFPYSDPGFALCEPYNTEHCNAIIAQSVQTILDTYKS